MLGVAGQVTPSLIIMVEEERLSEKRAVPRIGREVIVHYRIKEMPPLEGTQVSFIPSIEDISRTRDLAEKGIRFTVSRMFFPQTTLNVKLQLPLQKESIELEGRVISCEEVKKDIIYDLRLEFCNTGEEKRKLLKRFVQLFLKS